MKISITFFLVFISYYTFSQTDFEKGYMVNNEGKKIEILVKNEGWHYNPTTFKYKLFENSEIKNISFKDFLELNVNKFNFKTFIVEIDKSSDNLTNLSDKRTSNFEKDTLLLRTLVEGKASLYSYSTIGLKRFFYSIDNSNPKQLEYKKYNTIVTSNNAQKNKVLIKNTNDNYKYQLKTLFESNQNTSNVKYSSKDLINYFINYNKFKESDYKVYKPKNKSDFNLYVKAGIGFTSLDMNNRISTEPSDFKDEILPNFGFEFEYILPTNNSKWGLYTELLYLGNYENESTFKRSTGINFETEEVTISYSSLELSTGLKHYFFINDSSKIFLGIGYNFTVMANGEVNFPTGGGQDFKINNVPQNTFLLNLGYVFNNRFAFELKHQLNAKDIVRNSQSNGIWNSGFTRTSLMLSYNLF